MFIPKLTLGALTLVATALLFPSATIYFSNVHDYRIGFSELLPSVLLVIAALTLLLGITGSLLPRRWRPHLLALLAVSSIGFWLQANILVWNYGFLDGGQIPWQRHHARGVLEVFIWLGLLVVGWRHARQLAARAGSITGALLGIQLLGLAMSAWQAPPAPTHHRFGVEQQGQFQLSAEQNLVVIVLDAFQSDVFQQVLDEQPEFGEVFDGFTYFRNALAGYAKTYPSIPLMLSGQWYQNDEPIERFMARAYLRGSLPRQLRDADWDVRIYPHIMRTFHFDTALASNFVDQIDEGERLTATAQFFDVGLFRALPHFLKPWWLNDYAWRLQGMLPAVEAPATRTAGEESQRSQHTHSAIRWLEDMQALTAGDSANPAFRFYHLFVPHAPFLLNEALEMELLPSGREGFRRQSEAAMRLMGHYLTQLKATGLYDNTTIAIVSEHGGGEYQPGVETFRLGQPVSSNSQLPSEHHASGLPLVLIKPAATRGALRTSDAPVSLGDLAHTLATAVGLPQHDLPGEDMFSIAPEASRTRHFLFYEFDGFDVQYLPDLLEYEVLGHSWQAAAWQPSGRVLQSRGEARPGVSGPATTLEPGDRLHFAERGNGLRFLGPGWSTPEPGGSWSSATSAVIDLPLSRPLQSDLELQLHLRPFLSEAAEPPLRSQRVLLDINGIPSAQWEISSADVHSLTVDASVHGGSELLQLTLQLPDATRPAQLLLSEDVRQLGIELQQISLVRALNYALGTPLAFGEEGNAEDFIAAGWSVPESDFRWTVDTRASVQLPLAQQPDGDLQLRFTARAFTADPALPAQRLLININGSALGERLISGNDSHQVHIPAALLQGQRQLLIEFVLPDASRPSELGLSEDTRQLGIALQELSLDLSQ